MPRRDTHPALILAALWLLIFSASSQVIIVSPILPDIGAALDVGEFKLSTLVTVYSVMLSIFALASGPVSDKIGRRRILLIGAVLMSGALWLHGLAHTFPLLFAVRGLAGAAGGILSGAVVAYVGDYFPYERRGWANGWVMSGVAFGQVAGIPLGKILAGLGYYWPFLMFACTMGVAALLIWRYLPQPGIERDDRRLSFGRALRSYVRLVNEPGIPAAVVTYFLMFLGLGLFVVLLPTWLETEVGITGSQIALLFVVGGAANVLAAPAAGKLSDHVGRKPLIIASCLGFGLLMVVTTYAIVGFATAAVFFALAMITVGMRMSPLQSLLTALVPGERRGILMSLAVGIGQVGFGLGSTAAGAAYVEYGYVSNTLLGALSVFLMAGAVWRYLPEPAAEAPGVRSETASLAS